MLCKDVMRRPVLWAQVDESVATAARKMRDANIGFLPVCDRAERLVGVITDRDITIRVCAAGAAPADTLVESAMTPEIISCHPRDDLRRAQALMAETHRSRIVVRDEAGKLEGVISLSDVATCETAEAALILKAVASREVIKARQ